MKKENSKLKINNSKFENWRFLQRSVIHIYSGEVVLNNVDFENTEAMPISMYYPYYEPSGIDVGETDLFYSVPGIITSNKMDRDT